MTSWRLQQIATKPGFVIEQDRRLIEFVQKHGIADIMLDGDDDVDYFQMLLPDCTVSKHNGHGLLAVFANELFNRFEDVLDHVAQTITQLRPRYVYVAVNKYLITTNRRWDDLTDDIDQDILNILGRHMQSMHYIETARFSVPEDFGKHYNFAHPTTNAYYQLR